MPSKKTFLSQETTEFGRKVFMNLFELLCRKRAEGNSEREDSASQISSTLQENDLTPLLKDPEADWDETTLTVFGYNYYGLPSERYRYITYADGTEELYDHQSHS